MLKSVLLTLVSVMLCIIITFSAFGIELHPTAFFTDLLKVEGFVGDTADTILSARDKMQIFAKEWLPKVKEAFKPILDIFDSLRSLFEDLDERFAILDKLSTWLENVLNTLSDAFNYINIFVRYSTEYGIGVFDKQWWTGLGVAWRTLHEDIYKSEDGKIDFDVMYNVVDAFVYGEKNEFSYLVYDTSSINVSSAKYNQNTIVWHPDSIAYWFLKETFDNAEYWAVTSDLSLPENYATFLSRDLRFDYYFNYYWIPISNSNMVYLVDGNTYYLTGIRIARGSNPSVHKMTVSDVSVFYELEFSLIYQGSVIISEWVSPEDYFIGNTPYKASVLPSRKVRDYDDNGRYSHWDFTE